MHSQSSTKLERKKRQIEGRKGEKNGERIRGRKRNQKERGHRERGEGGRKERNAVQEPHWAGRLYFPKVAEAMSPLTTALLQYNFHTHPLRCVGLCFLPLNPGRLMVIVEVPRHAFMAKS